MDDLSISSSILSRQDSFVSFSKRGINASLGPTINNLRSGASTSNSRSPDSSIGASHFSEARHNNSHRNTSAAAAGFATPRRKKVENTKLQVHTGGGTLASTSKVGRLKVGIRCRPAFQDEVDFAQGNFMSIIETKSEVAETQQLGQVSLVLMSGKQREFLFDYVFDSNSTQDDVYDRIARPVVTDVLKGFNGTIFAYGQTGTGKVRPFKIVDFIL